MIGRSFDFAFQVWTISCLVVVGNDVSCWFVCAFSMACWLLVLFDWFIWLFCLFIYIVVCLCVCVCVFCCLFVDLFVCVLCVCLFAVILPLLLTTCVFLRVLPQPNTNTTNKHATKQTHTHTHQQWQLICVLFTCLLFVLFVCFFVDVAFWDVGEGWKFYRFRWFVCLCVVCLGRLVWGGLWLLDVKVGCCQGLMFACFIGLLFVLSCCGWIDWICRGLWWLDVRFSCLFVGFTLMFNV